MHSKGDGAPRGLAQLWGLSTAGARGPKPQYRITDVAAAGVAVADRLGLPGVTLEGVARQLDLTTTALYRYVDSKDDLLELAVDAAIGPPPRVAGATWQERVGSWTHALARRYREHPWLAGVPARGVPRRPGLYDWVEGLLSALDDAPADVDGMRLALMLDAIVRGYAGFGADPTPAPPWLPTALEGRFPRVAAELSRNWADPDDEIAAAIAVVLRGVCVSEDRTASLLTPPDPPADASRGAR